MTEPSDPKPQSLWDVMKRAGSTASTAETLVRNSGDESSAKPPKGLWKVMGLAGAASVPQRVEAAAHDDVLELEAVSDDEDQFPPIDAPAPDSRRQADAASRGLGSFAQTAPTATGREIDASSRPKRAESPAKFVSEARPKYDELKNQSRQAALRSGWWTLAVGLTAFVTSSLAYLESFWFRIPATALGLIALVWGLMALSAAARKQEDQPIKMLAGIGMACGLLGMFLGPLVFGGWGARARQEAAIADSRYHLEDIGYAINRYHAAKGLYPAGGTFTIRPDGSEQGMHGWMTDLLPYIDKADLHSMIDFNKPYDDPANFAVFSQSVPTFFASGGDRATIGRGFAVAHFAAVGGTTKDAKGRVIDLGVFGPNSSVRKAQVTDGASNTSIVGEVGYGYPAWGEPENWRHVGKGLNREPIGFGNAQSTGAIFLFADGAVKFFPNDTDPKVLKQLSTRNGDE